MQNSLTSFVLVVAVYFLAFLEHLQAQVPKEVTNSIGMKLVLISKGKFQMGMPIEGPRFDDDIEPQQVTITKDYYLGAFEVTQAQYEKIMGKNPSHFQGSEIAQVIPEKEDAQTGLIIEEEKVIPVDSSNYPVECVAWTEAVEFCRRLSELAEEKQAGRVYRLPTEAEWEYACRAGSETTYSFGESSESLGDYAWYRENSGDRTHPVGEKKANAWGLYDMHGNVQEWCSDNWLAYIEGSVDPMGPLKKTRFRVIRGGSLLARDWQCGSWHRAFGRMSGSNDWEVGFRVALSVTPRTSE